MEPIYAIKSYKALDQIREIESGGKYNFNKILAHLF